MFWTQNSGKILLPALVFIAVSLFAWDLINKEKNGAVSDTAKDGHSINSAIESGERPDFSHAGSPGTSTHKDDKREETALAKKEDNIQNPELQSHIQQPQELQPPPQGQVQPKAPEQPPARGSAVPGFNRYVLNIINTYKGKTYPYLLNNDYNFYNGVTTNLVYKDLILARAHPSGNRASHCVGITFEVFFKAMQQRNIDMGLCPNDFNGLTWDEMHDFLLTWYVANGPKSSSNLVRAVEKYGLGRGITNLEDARPGDFIDISRENNTGHAVVFIDWIRDGNGRIIGLNYWSSQPYTKGIGYTNEYFNVRDARGNKYGKVRLDNIYIARVH